MKRYKLKKDAPCAKAGIVFEERVDEFDGKILINEEFKYKIIVDCVNNFDDWLEEIPEHKRPRAEYGEKYHYINDCGDIVEDYKDEDDSDDYCYSIGNYGLTVKELEVKREYNIARQTLLDDAEGGKFIDYVDNWYVFKGIIDWAPGNSSTYMPGVIYFRTKNTAIKSLKEHKEQWEIVRKYETGEK